LLKVFKPIVEEFGTLGWKPSFKDYNKRDAIIDVTEYKIRLARQEECLP
jgi:hypothetical protein